MIARAGRRAGATFVKRMIPKSGNRFSDQAQSD
jgi:hypothetical protein